MSFYIAERKTGKHLGSNFKCLHEARNFAKSSGIVLGEKYISGPPSNDPCIQNSVWFLCVMSSMYIDATDGVTSDQMYGTVKVQLPGIFSSIPVGANVWIYYQACTKIMEIRWKYSQDMQDQYGDLDLDDWQEEAEGSKRIVGKMTMDFV